MKYETALKALVEDIKGKIDKFAEDWERESSEVVEEVDSILAEQVPDPKCEEQEEQLYDYS